ncbi:hypothetical protein P7K49_029422, partial [Saguinus oedipus]
MRLRLLAHSEEHLNSAWTQASITLAMTASYIRWVPSPGSHGPLKLRATFDFYQLCYWYIESNLSFNKWAQVERDKDR